VVGVVEVDLTLMEVVERAALVEVVLEQRLEMMLELVHQDLQTLVAAVVAAVTETPMV
jgi:hypothetical protein